MTDDAFEEIGLAIIVYLREAARYDPSECFRMVEELTTRLPKRGGEAENILKGLASEAAGEPPPVAAMN